MLMWIIIKNQLIKYIRCPIDLRNFKKYFFHAIRSLSISIAIPINDTGTEKKTVAFHWWFIDTDSLYVFLSVLDE